MSHNNDNWLLYFLMLIRLSTLLFFFLVSINICSAGDIEVSENFKSQTIGKGLHYFKDRSHQLTIDSLPPLDQWRTSKRETLNFGFTESSYWAQFNLQNTSNINQQLILEFAYPLLDKIDIYIQATNQPHHLTMGHNVPSSTRLLAHSNFLVPIELTASEKVRIIFRVTTDSTMQIPLKLWQNHTYIENNHRVSSYFGIFYGVLIAIALYHLLIFFSVRDKSFLYYSLFNASMLGAFLCLKGFPTAFIWPSAINAIDTALLIAICGGASFPCLFTNEILAVRNARPILARALRLISYSALGLAITALVMPYSIMIKLVLGLAAISLLINAGTHILRFMDGYPPAKYVFLAGVFSTVGILVTILEKSGIFPHSSWLEGAAYGGVLMMSMVYAFALSFQINMDRSLKDQMQRKLLETQAKLNADLDRRIAERTHEKEKMAILLKMTKALSKSDDKIVSAQTLLHHIKEILKALKLNEATLYVTQQSSDSLTEYKLWENGVEQANSIATEVSEDTYHYLLSLSKVTLVDHEILMPVRSEKKLWGYLVFSSYMGNHQTLDFDLLENMAQSFALSIESIEAEENSRLASVGAMAAAIVHDLKNPIGAIKGFAELATYSKSDSDRNDYLSTIIGEASRMSVMAHEVLEFSRNDIQLSLKTINARAFLDDVSTLLEQTFKAEGMHFESRCDTQKMITMDTERIRRTLLNMATNARDAMQSHHTANPTCSLTFSEENGAFVIQLQDNGPGVPDAIKAVLFEPFVTLGKSNGTGLGMAIVKKTINAHEGEISFITSDSGTHFRLAFPSAFHTKPSPSIQRLKGSNATLLHRHVLVAEDNPVNQKVLEKTLESLGISCDTVSNGAEAVHTASQKHFDLILMDIEMPVMNGIRASINIRQQPRNKATPIIALTGHTFGEHNDDSPDNEFTAIVSKPFTREILERAMTVALSNSILKGESQVI